MYGVGSRAEEVLLWVGLVLFVGVCVGLILAVLFLPLAIIRGGLRGRKEQRLGARGK